MFSWGLCFRAKGRVRVIYINDNDHKVRSNQGCYEEDEWEECGDVGFIEHGADDGSRCFVGGDVLGNCLASEA